jgi:glycosyltransferase involved in cell wall biosynthesis
LIAEPFGGAGVEAQLVGTPVLASSFGAMIETVEHGISGYHCHTLAD